LLIESAQNIKDAGGEVEFLCLEAIKLAPKKVDAYMLLLEAYTDIFESHDKVIFLFKLAETNEIKNLQFYKNCLTSLLKMNEVASTKELYEVIGEYSTDSERVILDFIKVVHLELANIGLAKIIWAKFLERKNFYDPKFYMSIISVGESVLDELNLKLIEEPQTQKDLDFNSNIGKIEEIVKKAIVYSYDTLNLLEPENPEFYFLKGMFLQNIDDASAESALKEAIKLDSTFSYANYELGMLYMNSGRLLSAYDQFRAVFKSPFYDVNLFLDTYINMSEICIKFGWIEEAENYLDEAKNISPKDYRVHLSLGKIFFKEAKIVGSEVALEKAEEHLSEAMELNPDNCEAAYYLGSVFYEERIYLPAIRYYQIALDKGLVNERGERFATPSNCYFWMSRAYYQMYKDLLFSSKEYLLEAIKFARSVPYDSSETPALFLEYLLELYNTIGAKDEVTKIERMLSAREREKKPVILKENDKAGVIKILTVFSPSVSEQSEKAVFSKGNLSNIEVVALPGNGNLIITGNIGESFRNSINVAFGFAHNYLINKLGEELVKSKDIIVDIPGWFPKYDGPSAGSGISISIVSAILNKPIPVNITATGEISVLGNILPVGGIKEKIEATIDKGIDRVYIPKDNKWDYLDMLLKGEDTSKLPEVVAVSNVSQIIEDLLF
jgi:tetratricopeptide (TPR) repeat protein